MCIIDEEIRYTGSIGNELRANAGGRQGIFPIRVRTSTRRCVLLRPGVCYSAKESGNTKDALGQHAE